MNDHRRVSGEILFPGGGFHPTTSLTLQRDQKHRKEQHHRGYQAAILQVPVTEQRSGRSSARVLTRSSSQDVAQYHHQTTALSRRSWLRAQTHYRNTTAIAAIRAIARASKKVSKICGAPTAKHALSTMRIPRATGLVLWDYLHTRLDLASRTSATLDRPPLCSTLSIGLGYVPRPIPRLGTGVA